LISTAGGARKDKALLTVMAGHYQIIDGLLSSRNGMGTSMNLAVIAQSNKKSDITIIQDQLIQFAVSPHGYIAIAPIISPQLCQDLTLFNFMVSHPNDTKTGIQPFIIINGMEEQRAASIEVACNFGLISEGNL